MLIPNKTVGLIAQWSVEFVVYLVQLSFRITITRFSHVLITFVYAHINGNMP